MTGTFFQRILSGRLLPAVTFPVAKHASRIAELFLKHGLNVMEIPLRTEFALPAISEIRRNFPSMHIGAGTVLNVQHLQSAIDAGAMFGVSPGFNSAVCNAAVAGGVPFIPGVMTPTEMEFAVSAGYHVLKLFPA